ncbi:hypothetical protein WH47_02676 [Habropoda laboriosa]|uniref:Uncharacterized protein n=1 Tax=Habropoda laboriosa TaxID=597456 RepID=A0A0L7QX22_9HYME|nr:hypothetical protein WH47_02676 [Habropoda laboriosa]
MQCDLNGFLCLHRERFALEGNEIDDRLQCEYRSLGTSYANSAVVRVMYRAHLR